MNEITRNLFLQAWDDLRKSPSWAWTSFRLMLLRFVPIFGIIASNGFTYAWAREIAWDMNKPLGNKIFIQEDDGFYARGALTFLLQFIFMGLLSFSFFFFAVMPTLFASTNTGVAGVHDFNPVAIAGMLMSFVFSNILLAVLTIIVEALVTIASVRVSIYQSFSSGFQLSVIWKMVSHKSSNLIGIIALGILANILICVGIGIAWFIFGVAVVVLAFSASLEALIIVAIILGSAVLCASAWAATVVDIVNQRAFGYWTRQFDVPAWGGQDEPLPFERVEASEL